MAFLRQSQDTAGRSRRGIWRALVLGATLVAAAASTGGCAGKASRPDASAVALDPADLARARALAAVDAGVPERAEALALAESVEAAATREGTGPRAVELHLAAAHLLERVWRVEGREQDAKEALEVYRTAARDADSRDACEAALAGARLAGDVQHDATASYAELYRAQRRFAAATLADAGDPGGCPRALEAGLSLLGGFRPPQRVLEAIDEGLTGEGLLTPSASAHAEAVSPPKAPQVTRIDAFPGRDATRVVVVLDRPAEYRVGDEMTVGGTPRTFLDLDGVDLGPAPRDTPLAGVVERVHAESTTTGTRISFELDGKAWRRVFHMREPYRIVIDVARHRPGEDGRDPRQVTRVVLDPGHGGRDTGAVGPSGEREKDVTLDIAHRVAPVLARAGIQVILTRDDDRFVSLEERTARANAFGADLFLSVHCNASESKGRRGVETYVLDTTRDEIAARVAARENDTTQAQSAELAAILGGMRVADDAKRSLRFAQLLQRASTSAVQTRYGDAIDGGVHPAGFYVLVGARMPSALFETSYISNPIDDQRFGTEEYRQLMADAIANAVEAYRQGR